MPCVVFGIEKQVPFMVYKRRDGMQVEWVHGLCCTKGMISFIVYKRGDCMCLCCENQGSRERARQRGEMGGSGLLVRCKQAVPRTP